MGGLTVAGEIKSPNLIDMLVFAYASSEHDCNYKYLLNVMGKLIEPVTFWLPVHFSGKFARSYTK